MWIEKLEEVFENFRKYKGWSINPELNNLRDELSAWVDAIITSRSNITKIKGFDLNQFKFHLNITIRPWLEDLPPYETVDKNGKKKPTYKPYAECKGDEFYKIALQFFDHFIDVYKLKLSQEVKNE